VNKLAIQDDLNGAWPELWKYRRQTASNPFHPSPLFPRRFQLPIPLGLNLLLMPGEHVPRRDGLAPENDRDVESPGSLCYPLAIQRLTPILFFLCGFYLTRDCCCSIL